MVDPATAVQRGTAAHRTGALVEAETWYRRASALAPDDFDASYLMGRARADLGDAAAAGRHLRRAVAISPGVAASHASLGNCLRALGRLGEAQASYGQALRLDPHNVDLLINQGVILVELGRADDALTSFGAALAIQPGCVDALANRAALHGNRSRWSESLIGCRRAIALEPPHVEALNNCGNALAALGQAEPAMESYERALATKPSYVEALSNRSSLLRNLKRLPASLANARRALALQPGHVKALNSHATTLKQLGALDAARSFYNRALSIDPSFPDSLNNRANVLNALGRFEEAVADIDALLATDPDSPYAAGNRLHFQMMLCDWRDLDRRSAQVTDAVRSGRPACTPFAFFSITESLADQLSCGESFCRRQFANAMPRSSRPGTGRRSGPIRLAYLSANFGEHAISHLLAGVFERHDRGRFETIAISFASSDGSPMRARVEAAFDRFIEVHGRSDRDIAGLIRDLDVDVSVDLMGHTQDSRLGIFALRPAPVSVNFFCPTGADFIDYMIADPVAVPADHQRFYREKVAYLPDTFLATDRSRAIGAHTPSRRELGLPEDAFVFCCFNNAYKINPRMFGIWMKLLREVTGSVLWLQHTNPIATRNLLREATSRGIDPTRLVFAPRIASTADHLARYRQADLFLDTLPFNAQTTAADALWAGLPVVTCLGSTFVGRVAASLLSALAVPELIVDSLSAYEALALELARDRPRLAAIKAKIERHRRDHPAFDTERYCGAVESAFSTMIERARNGQEPASFTVGRPG